MLIGRELLDPGLVRRGTEVSPVDVRVLYSAPESGRVLAGWHEDSAGGRPIVGGCVTSRLIHDDATGLLPEGIHEAQLDDVEAAFVIGVADNRDLRRAVYAGICSWLHHVRSLIGGGKCWISGGFVSLSEPTDTALVGFEPSDRALASLVAGTDHAIDLVGIGDLVYSTPAPGGALRRRLPVSGLVDAHLVDVVTRRSYHRAFAAVVGADGFPVPNAVKGFVEVELG